MKVCPKCQASWAEGFVCCPHDHTLLTRFDLRAELRRVQKRELNLLLPTLSFSQRLQRELSFAVQELRRHPRLFLSELLRGEGSSRRRFYLLQSGAALAVMAYTFIVTALVLFGVSHGIPGEPVALAKPPQTMDEMPLIVPLLPLVKSDYTRGRNGHLGGSLPQPQQAHGGGSGGNHELTPANGGATPPAALQPQIVLPNPHKPMIEHASLIVPMHVMADPLSVRSGIGQIGLSDVPPAPPSSGQGEGGGMGNGRSTGVGNNGDGAGLGPGRDFNTGKGSPRIGGRPPTGEGDREGLPMAVGAMRPTILYREKARYTEDARDQKTQGSVILLATFTADGRITDIRALKSLPHGLTEEAIKAAQRIRFHPAFKNGVAVTVQARLEYNFALY